MYFFASATSFLRLTRFEFQKRAGTALFPVCTTTKPAAPRFAVFEAWAPRSRHNARQEQATAVSYEQKTRQRGKKHPRIFANAKSNETFPQPRTTKFAIPVTSNLYSNRPMRPDWTLCAQSTQPKISTVRPHSTLKISNGLTPYFAIFYL